MTILVDGELVLYGFVGDNFWDEGFTATDVIYALAEVGRTADITVRINETESQDSVEFAIEQATAEVVRDSLRVAARALAEAQASGDLETVDWDFDIHPTELGEHIRLILEQAEPAPKPVMDAAPAPAAPPVAPPFPPKQPTPRMQAELEQIQARRAEQEAERARRQQEAAQRAEERRQRHNERDQRPPTPPRPPQDER